MGKNHLPLVMGPSAGRQTRRAMHGKEGRPAYAAEVCRPEGAAGSAPT